MGHDDDDDDDDDRVPLLLFCKKKVHRESICNSCKWFDIDNHGLTQLLIHNITTVVHNPIENITPPIFY